LAELKAVEQIRAYTFVEGEMHPQAQYHQSHVMQQKLCRWSRPEAILRQISFTSGTAGEANAGVREKTTAMCTAGF